ncbi:LysR family transcriptional regulator [Chitinophaga tropicalis]|uniref:LysR family transcriptional regulator n=1 Tax=Chitinophaga tropicalis TaxID=2683588 RepID=A0A7K1UCX2_9BACT|nr:LysR family transcriptional regulator [Chitinophaga tropicalis]MVT12118.1 LysR family transcriptional regulator [Chitinophaga tropicalis]
MNTNDLKIFEAVAACGNFTKAAETMFTVQSNVTARIRSLEQEFNTELFLRNSRKVALTPAGEILMRYSKQIAYLLEKARTEMQGADQVSGVLKIGCIETTMALKVPQMLQEFMEAHPNVDLEFTSSLRTALIQEVLNYRLDAAFVSAPINIPGLQADYIKEEQLVIITSSKVSSLTALAKENKLLTIVVFDQGCVFRERLESWLSAKGIVQYKEIVVNSLEGIVNFVETGLGISILPQEIINAFYARRKLKTFPLNKELATMTTVLIYRNDIPPSGALQAFIDMYKTGD